MGLRSYRRRGFFSCILIASANVKFFSAQRMMFKQYVAEANKTQLCSLNVFFTLNCFPKNVWRWLWTPTHLPFETDLISCHFYWRVSVTPPKCDKVVISKLWTYLKNTNCSWQDTGSCFRSRVWHRAVPEPRGEMWLDEDLLPLPYQRKMVLRWCSV